MNDASLSGPPAGDHGIDEALAYCISHAEREGISLQETLGRLGPASFCFVSLLLSVPFIQPFSLGPYTFASGVTFMVAGWQMLRGHPAPNLPSAMGRIRIHGRGWLAALHFCQRILAFCRKFTRPRLTHWVNGKAGEKLIGWFVFTGGALLTIPMANLPFNNTLPALMILFAAIAWLERDGLMLIVSLFWGLLTLVYFVAVAKLAWFIVVQGFQWVKSHLPAGIF